MCLLITKPEGVDFDEAFLRGVYDLNKDGIGVMYAKDNTLFTRKAVPKNFEDVIAFWKQNVGERECAIHFRMQTHGDIDLHNCHPYQVLSAEDGYPLWLMHNGVLHTGNAKDTSKSDTWHYIQTYLRPMLLRNPEFFLNPAFAELVGEHIGTGNKFVLMDAYGNTVTVNENQFVEHNGAMLSNTYAWDTTGTKHHSRSWATKYAGLGAHQPKTLANQFDLDDDTDFGDAWFLPGYTKAAKPKSVWDEDDASTFAECLFSALEDAALYEAYRSIAFDEALAFYHADPDEAWELLDMVESGYLQDAEVIEFVTGALNETLEPEDK